jgi:predicted anti-sigma-YlaC factor YlaD
MEPMTNNCAGMDSKLADLLLDPASAPGKVKNHVAECESCRGELEELRATMALMDTWTTPEPNPYFMPKLGARMREEREAQPAGWAARWVARLRARVAYGPTLHARPLAAMALTVMLLVGGGTYLGVTNWEQPTVPSPDAAVVHDSQTLDNNAQLLDQLEQISSSASSEDSQ